MLVQFQGVSKAFGSQPILRDVTFQINPKEKIGLIGSNGAGKSTLLKIMTRRTEPDEGALHFKSSLRIGSLDQIPDFHEDTSVLEEGLRSFAALIDAESEMRTLEHRIAANAGKEVVDRYSVLQHEFELKGGYSFRAQTEAALLGVGFSKDSLTRPSRVLSGGEKNRLALAKLLLAETELLLLDEPTNHLDIRSLEWLEGFLQDTEKTVVVVSHDRFFLDRVVTRILEIEGSRISDYHGNYSTYLRERAERQARQQKEWELQQEWIEKQEDYIRRNIAGQKTKQAQSRRKLLARVHRIEQPRSSSTTATFRFLPVERSSRFVFRAKGVSIGHESPLVSDLHLSVERGERWAILGPNGSGKTTLLKTIIGAVAPLGGDIEWTEALDYGYYDQQLASLSSTTDILDELRQLDSTATDGELRTYLAQFLFTGDQVFKKVAALSGGEKSRLALAKIIYEQPQLLVLDEPTNHLDINSREALEGALANYPGTILFVTHDRYLTQKIATNLLYLENGKAYLFDRLSAFEEWLAAPRPEALNGSSTPLHRPIRSDNGMSKNRREKLQTAVAELEKQIALVEQEISHLEASFQNPGPETDWQVTHRRYDELKASLDELYAELAGKWDLLG